MVIRVSCGVAVLVAAVALAGACVRAAKVEPCGPWQLYKQCTGPWANHELGTGDLTICDAGCAMSCVAMSMATFGERIHHGAVNPGTLNKWLTAHGGYVDTDDIVWNSVAPLGKLHLDLFKPALSQAEIRKHIDRCDPVIANVREGHHWVLLIGYDTKDEDTFYVNDPGFLESTYQYSGMSYFTVYTNSTGTAAASRAAHQPAPSLLADASKVGRRD